MAIGLEQNHNGSGKGCFSYRYVMAIMGSIGLAIIYGFKVNMSITLVSMINHTAVKQMGLNYNASEQVNVTKTEEDGPFAWDGTMEGYILSAYFIGYLISMIPGARMAELVSAKWVMNIAVLLNVIASFLSPISAQISVLLLCFMRVIQGIGGGVSFPAMHVMITKWGPPAERNVLASIVYAGTAIGTLIAILLSGVIANNLGWRAVFYIEGGLCLIWCTGWWLMIEDSPQQQKRFISQEEKDFIMDSQGESNDSHNQKLSVPWSQIAKSPAFLAILIAHFCSNVAWYMFLVELPIFMNKVLKFDLQSNAILSSIPYLCMWVFTMLLSKVLAIIVDKGWITITLSRKIGTFFSSVIPMICLVMVTWVGDNPNVVVVFMMIGVTCMGGMFSGFLANHIDIASNFAGILVAITNFFATIPGILVPHIVSALTKGSYDDVVRGWNTIFYITVFILAIEIIIYSIFGSGNEQPWNKIGTKIQDANEEGMALKQNHES